MGQDPRRPTIPEIARRTGAENGLLEPSYKSSRCPRRSATIDRVAIESATLPSAPLPPTVAAATFGVAGRADGKRVTQETCCLLGSLLNHGKCSERTFHQATIHLVCRMEHSGNAFAPALSHIRSGNSSFACRGCRSGARHCNRFKHSDRGRDGPQSRGYECSGRPRTPGHTASNDTPDPAAAEH